MTLRDLVSRDLEVNSYIDVFAHKLIIIDTFDSSLFLKIV